MFYGISSAFLRRRLLLLTQCSEMTGAIVLHRLIILRLSELRQTITKTLLLFAAAFDVSPLVGVKLVEFGILLAGTLERTEQHFVG